MAIDATTAGTAANSYLTVADADALAADLGLSASWSAKTVDEKEAALKQAAVEIDGHRFHDFEPYTIGQARVFPRWRDIDRNTGAVSIPMPVKHAAILQAEWIATAGPSDRSQWEGRKATPLKDAGGGSPLCPRAFNVLSRFISRVGRFI